MSLNDFVPEIRHPVIGGKHVTVAPLKVRQIPPFMRAVGPASQALFAGDVAAAVALHGEALIEAVAVATGEQAEWLGDLDADEFLRLVGEVVEVNADFFGQRVVPELTRTTNRLTTALAGQMPLPSSPTEASRSEMPST